MTKRRSVLITGASSGIGFETARMFIDNGDFVYFNGRDETRLSGAVKALDSKGTSSGILIGDVSCVKNCEKMIREVEKSGTGLDVLVNSAGIWLEGKSDQMTEDMWDQVMDINAKGTFFMCRYAIPLLERSEGVIVNVSSDSGLVGNNEAAIYCASKGAVTLITKSLAVELAPRGIRVNAVCPGDVETPMLDRAFKDYGGNDRSAYDRSLLDHYPQGDRARFTKPEEVARSIFFLASPSVKAITGACLSIDFGLTAGY